MRYSSSETVRVYAELPEGSDDVTIAIYVDGVNWPLDTDPDPADDTIGDNTCSEEATGVYFWSSDNFNNTPSGYATIMYIVTENHTGHSQAGKFCLGGWPNLAGTGGGGGVSSWRGGTTVVLEGETDDTELLKLRKQVKKMQDKLKGKENG